MISSNNVPGGLANQMFQYAAGYAHAKRMGTEFFYPVKPIGEDKRSPNLHDIFHLTASQTGQHGPLYDDVPTGFHYTPIPECDHMTLNGYFQSAKYFKECEEEIRKEFTFRNPTNLIVPKGTVSVHVRRSDYLKFPNHHPLCSMEYYRTAMAKFEGYNFLVLSDDREWCAKWFDLPNTVISKAHSAQEDLQLMSKCDHHIMANSSFSWWGAWLNTQEGKRVIIPEKWFGSAYNRWDTSDLYHPSWEKL
tara:strand:+ start:25046 stop:25789 length:744 start_codon:yes stop_codon:yes gene_type:complete